VTRIVVTGSGGFIGSVVTDRLLADGHEVVGVDDWSTGHRSNLDRATRDSRFRLECLDIRDERLSSIFAGFRPEVVMHLAGQSCMRPSVDDPLHDASVNILGSLNVLRAAVEATSRKIIYAASGGTLYGEPPRVPVREEDRFVSRPSSPYGISKRVVEDYLHFFHETHDLDFTMLAMSNVYGPRQDPLGDAGVISIFAGTMLRGERPTILGDGEQTRDYVYVGDVAEAFVRAIARGPASILNIGSGTETTVNHIYRMVASHLGFRGTAQRAPAKPGEPRRVALDPTAAGRLLGWKAHTSLEQGVKETVEWVQNEDRSRARLSSARS
jgi:UDP-glucose 4-epimerase